MRHSLLALLLAAAAGPALAQSGAPTPGAPAPRVPPPAAAPSNAELMANDHYTRSHDYDLVHQRIAVSAFDWDSLSFEGSVVTTLVAERPGLDSIVLDEGALLVNTSVTDRRGTALRSSRSGDTLVIFPASPAAFGDTLTFTVAYHGKIKNGDGLTYITPDGLPHRPRQIWSQGEDHNNHDWFPTFDFPSDKMSWELAATVPEEDIAVSNGRLVSNVVRAGQRTMTWRQDAPSATYLVSLIVAPLVRIHDSWQGIPVDYYVYREDSARAWPLFHVTPDMIGTYARLTGVRYPWDKYAQTTVADFFGGMENVSATTLVDWLPDARAYRDRPWYQHDLIPHELAHQWFGDYVTTVNWANMWLNEGFAEFMPGQYWGEKLGPLAEQDYYANEYRQYLGIDRRRPMPLASLGSNNIYPKGALVLEMLKRYLGPERFWASVHAYLVRHAFGTATTDDLRQAVLAATGENLDWFWSEWMYQAGYPQLDVSAAYDSARRTVTLAVRQTQPDTLTPDSTGLRFTVPAVFRMPLVVRVGTAAGDVTKRIELRAREQTDTIAGVASPPTMVVFDDGNAVLKSLHFDQPTAWLAAQLARDPDVWDREWAIEQLEGRPGDPAAVAALADAATRADWWLIRGRAAAALAHAPADAALPALEAAARDTSADVREAAVEALGELGGPRAVALARAAFDGDSSYAVRAAAVGALTQADPGHAADVVRAALGQPSYQDQIQNAAFRAIAVHGDTSFVGVVDSLFAASQFPAFVLAALGARGSQRALDLLTRRLDDPRRAVRGWALQAFRFGMPRALALARLRGAVDGLQSAGAKQAVTDAIARLAAAPGGP
ncbi:MAG TPA: M1 family aminopeptidase [Gemmatimonadales bacterium]|nr:M1 family aminopeptidase [Gemmatimonadales bacterium]